MIALPCPRNLHQWFSTVETSLLCRSSVAVKCHFTALVQDSGLRVMKGFKVHLRLIFLQIGYFIKGLGKTLIASVSEHDSASSLFTCLFFLCFFQVWIKSFNFMLKIKKTSPGSSLALNLVTPFHASTFGFQIHLFTFNFLEPQTNFIFWSMTLVFFQVASVNVI